MSTVILCDTYASPHGPSGAALNIAEYRIQTVVTTSVYGVDRDKIDSTREYCRKCFQEMITSWGTGGFPEEGITMRVSRI